MMFDIVISGVVYNPFEKVEVFILGHREFEEFIERVFVQEFDLVADQGLRNGDVWTATVYGKLHKYEEVDLFNFWKTGRGDGVANILLEYMCIEGIIEKGRYYIEVY
jgi:hypothetical protein